MNIKKLYTLSQFVDDIPVGNTGLDALRFIEVKKYNEFLKQLLTKEMFVNEIVKPMMKPESIYDENRQVKTQKNIQVIRYEKWEEAEKKVIFEGFKRINNTLYNNNFKELEISISSGGYIAISCNYYEPFMKGLNLSDLAEKMNERLKLKNVNL